MNQKILSDINNAYILYSFCDSLISIIDENGIYSLLSLSIINLLTKSLYINSLSNKIIFKKSFAVNSIFKMDK